METLVVNQGEVAAPPPHEGVHRGDGAGVRGARSGRSDDAPAPDRLAARPVGALGLMPAQLEAISARSASRP